MSTQRRPIHFAIIFLTAVITAVSVGCTNDPRKEPVSEYEIANKEISDGNYNAAIATMSSRLEDHPHDKKARVILASAYAARGGVLMGEYVDVVNRILRHIGDSDAVIDNQYAKLFVRWQKQVKEEDQRGILDIFSKVYVATFRIGQLVTAFEIIPNLSDDNRRDLGKAVTVLDGVEGELNGGPALYSGLLRLILLKNSLHTKYDLAYLNKCSVDLSQLANQLEELHQDVQGIMINLANGFYDKKKSAKMKRASKNLDKSFADAVDAIQSFSFYQEVDVTDLTGSLGGKCTP